MPKYLKLSAVVINGVLTVGLCLSSCKKKKNIDTDLELLILYPENLPECSIILIRLA